MARYRYSLLLIAVCAALLLGLPAAPAHAIGGIVVSSLKDTDTPNADACTLREALQAIANAKAAGQAKTYHECYPHGANHSRWQQYCHLSGFA